MKGPAVLPRRFFLYLTYYPCRREKRPVDERAHTRVVIFILSLTLLFSAHIATPTAHSQETIDDLYKLFTLEEIRSDFVIVLDTSGSMNEENRFENAKKALTSFTKVLAPGDHISIITFDNLASLLISREVSTDIKSVLDQIPAKPNPKGDTAIGLALEMTLQELERPRANQSQFVFFLTDGTDDPPSGGKFKKGIWDQNWEALTQKSRDLINKRLFKAYGIGLKKGTDVELLRKVFGDEHTSILTLRGKDLVDYFKRQKEIIRREKLKAAVTQEIKAGGLQIAHAGQENLWQCHARLIS